MANLKLSIGCGPYDRTEALRSGIVQPEGIDLTYVPIQSPPEIFARMIKNHAFDFSNGCDGFIKIVYLIPLSVSFSHQYL